VVVSPQFDDVRGFSNGLARVNIGAKESPPPVLRLVGGKWGYIDPAGRLVMPVHFEGAEDVSEGLARVAVEGKYYFIDRNGAVPFKVPEQWFVGARFWEGLAPVQVSDKHGFINKHGKWVVRPRFDDVDDFSEDLAAVRLGKKWGFINRGGEIVIEARFKEVGSFSEKLARVRDGKTWSFIDKTGKVIIRPRRELSTRRRILPAAWLGSTWVGSSLTLPREPATGAAASGTTSTGRGK
jgi:hypothetical protein